MQNHGCLPVLVLPRDRHLDSDRWTVYKETFWIPQQGGWMLTGDQIPWPQPSIPRPWSLGVITLITTNILGAHRVPGPTLSTLYGLATKCPGSKDTTLGGGAGNWRNPETSEIKFIIQRRKRNLDMIHIHYQRRLAQCFLHASHNGVPIRGFI